MVQINIARNKEEYFLISQQKHDQMSYISFSETNNIYPTKWGLSPITHQRPTYYANSIPTFFYRTSLFRGIWEAKIRQCKYLLLNSYAILYSDIQINVEERKRVVESSEVFTLGWLILSGWRHSESFGLVSDIIFLSISVHSVCFLINVAQR